MSAVSRDLDADDQEGADVFRRMVSTTSPRRRTTAAVFVLTVAASLLVVAPFADARTGSRVAERPPTVRTVTLLTGDVVHVLDHGSGQPTIALGPGPDGRIPRATISLAGGHAYVVPESAAVLVAAHKLALGLFDVNALVRQGYGDARSAVMPLIVDYGHGARAATRARNARLASARKTVQIPALGMAAFAERKARARDAWTSLTAAPNAAGAPTALAGGATRVYLDGKVHAEVDPNVEQVHAPEAWAAGYDGTGAKVAVLDTGYDPTHPDLAGVVTSSANFTSDPTVVDGNGHGTHVAATIAGNGTGSAGLHGGVAPGARLIVGKVLDSNGQGDDSWVLAGMEWAVANGADVVNMSLGGDPSDGTDPLSQAIDELSASSKTLFVVAAGNDGPDAGTVTDPGAADAALTVGAVDSSDYLAYFSSRGPRSGDHGLKPDVVAPGVGIVAARAAGTSLGDPVDSLYTSLSGTSMATPHVTGLAAILAAEHPTWDGERIKEAIVDSTDPAPGATAFEAGSGRIDAERAVHETVLGTPSIELGSFPYPQSGLTTVTKRLTYENDSDAAVTLSLALESEGGDMAVPGGVSLSASSVEVPAHGSAGVDVVLDPAVADTGAQSGVVDATANGISVRSTFGYWLESEHYDLTVEVAPRAGTQSATTTVGLTGLQSVAVRPARSDEQRFARQHHLPGSARDLRRHRPDDGSVVRRRQRGRGGVEPGRQRDGDHACCARRELRSSLRLHGRSPGVARRDDDARRLERSRRLHRLPPHGRVRPRLCDAARFLGHRLCGLVDQLAAVATHRCDRSGRASAGSAARGHHRRRSRACAQPVRARRVGR